ncbi:tyrosine-type recombinase/integrase, partial [Staphylococcus lugdunensis]
ELRNELKLYIEDCKLEDEELIFQSTRTHQCLSRQQAYRIINRAAEQLGMKHIGLTTLRKTFAYHAYHAGISISIIQKY